MLLAAFSLNDGLHKEIDIRSKAPKIDRPAGPPLLALLLAAGEQEEFGPELAKTSNRR